MDPTLLGQLLLAALVVWLILRPRDPPRFWRHLGDALDRLDDELRNDSNHHRRWARLPVVSAESLHRKEAEFICERLPRKSPRAHWVLALLVIGVFVWWLTR